MMNHVDKLIANLCPHGVPYYSLGEIGKTVSGLRGKSKDDFSDGNAPYISYVDIFNNPGIDFIPEKRVKVDPSESQSAIRRGDVLVTGSSETRNECGMTAVVTSQPSTNVYVNSFCFIWRPNGDVDLDPEFAKHLFRGRAFRDKVIATANGVTRQNISKPKFLAIEIPLPPIEVQLQVASILNQFTQLELELEVVLEAELESRRSQYAFFASALTNDASHSQIRKVSLADVAEIGTGSRNTQDAEASGAFPFFVRSQKPLASNQYEFDEAAVITAGDGVGVGKVFHFYKGKYSLHQRAYRIRPNEEILHPKYLFYYMRTHFGPYLEMNAVHASVTSLRRPMFEKFEVVIPSMDAQLSTVNFLDSMEAYIGDLSSGLSGEIFARRQQYEYYRDRLLSFQRLVVQ
jgi:type I restriction enzyme S subunit